MSEQRCLNLTGDWRAFGCPAPGAIWDDGAEKRKSRDPKTSEIFRLLLGFSLFIAGLYFGLFTTGSGEGLGFLALLASPFAVIIDEA